MSAVIFQAPNRQNNTAIGNHINAAVNAADHTAIPYLDQPRISLPRRVLYYGFEPWLPSDR